MATNWLSGFVRNVFGGRAPGGGGTNPLYVRYRQQQAQAQTSRGHQVEYGGRYRQGRTYAARMTALANYYRTKSLGGTPAAVRYYEENRPRTITTSPYTSDNLSWYRRTGYAQPGAMTLDEYMRRQWARRNYGYPTFAPTTQEWILRQNSAPPGYVWTPYAGWVREDVFNAQLGVNRSAPQTNPNIAQPAYYTGYGSSGYGSSGGGGGGGSIGTPPDWYSNFLSQFAWRI